MTEISCGNTEVSSLDEVGSDREVLNFHGVSVRIPERPWMPTHAGTEIRVVDLSSGPLVQETYEDTLLPLELMRVARVAAVSAEVAGVFSEADDPKNPDWYDKPWFNLNINSHLGLEKVKNLMCQVFLRARTLGQTRGLKAGKEYVDETDKWSNPYWTVPVPVEYPLNPADRGRYDEALQAKVKSKLEAHFRSSGTEGKFTGIKLFTDANGKNTLDTEFPFKINKGNYPVWQMGDYLLVTQDNPLVDRKDGVHLVLIYRGEQQGENEHYAFHWRNPRRIAEMALISAAVSKIITEQGYAGNTFDKSYIHLNANWSLNNALSEEERKRIDEQYPLTPEDIKMGRQGMNFGSVAPGGWPGPRENQSVPGPNVHPHIQILKTDERAEKHEFSLPPSGKYHNEHPRDRQTDEEIVVLKDLLATHLTPVISGFYGKSLI